MEREAAQEQFVLGLLLFPYLSISSSGVLSLDGLLELGDFLNNLCDVLDQGCCILVQAQPALLEHSDAIRAGSGHDFSPHINCLLYAEIGEPLFLGGLHPNPAPSTPATQAPRPGILHLLQLQTE